MILDGKKALSGPDGFPLWVADVEPGSVHDLTVAREQCSAPCAMGLHPVWLTQPSSEAVVLRRGTLLLELFALSLLRSKSRPTAEGGT